MDASVDQRPHGRRGRPPGPSPKVAAAVVAAAGAELAEAGYAAMSMERVAVRADVHRSTLYKHWPTRRDLVLAVARSSYTEHRPDRDTGTWEGDLRAMVADLIDALSQPGDNAVFGALAAAGQSDPELRQAVLEMWRATTEPRLAPIVRAQQRGEIAADIDPGLLLESISTPLVMRMSIIDAPLTPHFLEWTIQLILRGTRPTS